MDRMSVAEAAHAWGVSERLVQRWCSEGAVPGAEKFGRSWSIPVGARSPSSDAADTTSGGSVAPDSSGKTRASNATPRGLAVAADCMPLMNTPFAPGGALDAVASIPSPRAREIAEAELRYFSGDYAGAAQIAGRHLGGDVTALSLSARLLYVFSNLPLGRADRSLAALGAVGDAVDRLGEGSDQSLSALSRCVRAAAEVLLHLPSMEGEALPSPQLVQDVRRLPQGLRLFALYVSAHAAYLAGDYGRCAGTAEAALAAPEQVYPIPAIYLHLVAVMGYIGLKRTDMARHHVLEAWELARPDGLIEPLAEHHGLLGGMLEAVIKPDWPDDFKKIIEHTYRFSAGWRSVHNPVTGESVADNLTTTEFAIAMLASRGWPNQDIAEHLGVTVSTVKSTLSSAFHKLGVSQREDLERFMLR